MQDLVRVTGLVLKAIPVGEYDKSLTILTKERGKISAFVRGARRPNSRFLAMANPFSFGRFDLYPGRSAYNIHEAQIQNYFESLREDFDGACYGFYFLEIAEYYTRENNDETQMLKLLYQSLRALQHESLDRHLIRRVYELRAMAVNGEFGLELVKESTDDLLYTLHFILETPIEKVYTFRVSEQLQEQLDQLGEAMCRRVLDRPMKSLALLTSIY